MKKKPIETFRKLEVGSLKFFRQYLSGVGADAGSGGSIFLHSLKASKAFLQVSVGVSTQYDETVIENVELHQLALRSEVLGVVSEFTVEQVEGKTGRDQLADSIKDAINARLEELEGFGGVEGVFFTSFVLQ